MSIASLRLDETSKLEFGISITGADSAPKARLIIEGKDFDVAFSCKKTESGVEVEIPELASIFKAGEYQTRLEVIVEGKIFTPLEDTIVFEPTVEVAAKNTKVVTKESFKVDSVSVKKAQPSRHLVELIIEGDNGEEVRKQVEVNAKTVAESLDLAAAKYEKMGFEVLDAEYITAVK